MSNIQVVEEKKANLAEKNYVNSVLVIERDKELCQKIKKFFKKKLIKVTICGDYIDARKSYIDQELIIMGNITQFFYINSFVNWLYSKNIKKEPYIFLLSEELRQKLEVIGLQENFHGFISLPLNKEKLQLALDKINIFTNKNENNNDTNKTSIDIDTPKVTPQAVENIKENSANIEKNITNEKPNLKKQQFIRPPTPTNEVTYADIIRSKKNLDYRNALSFQPNQPNSQKEEEQIKNSFTEKPDNQHKPEAPSLPKTISKNRIPNININEKITKIPQQNQPQLPHPKPTFFGTNEKKPNHNSPDQTSDILASLFDNMQQAIAILDKNMRYLAVNKSWLKEFNKTKAELIGRSQYEVFTNIDANWKKTYEECLKGKIQKRDDDIYLRDDGTQIQAKWEVRPWRNENNQISGLIIISETKEMDSEDIKNYEESQIINFIIEGSHSTAMVILDTEGKIHLANPASLRIARFASPYLENSERENPRFTFWHAFFPEHEQAKVQNTFLKRVSETIIQEANAFPLNEINSFQIEGNNGISQNNYILWQYYPLFLEDEPLEKILLIGADLSRSGIEQVIEQNIGKKFSQLDVNFANLFDKIANNLPSKIIRFNSSGDAVYINKELTKFLGFETNKKFNKIWQNAIHEDDVSTFYENLHNSAFQQNIKTQIRLKNHNNKYIPITLNCAPYPFSDEGANFELDDENQNFSFIVICTENETEQKDEAIIKSLTTETKELKNKLEQIIAKNHFLLDETTRQREELAKISNQLSATKNISETILNNCHEPLLLIENSGKILQINSPTLEILGYQKNMAKSLKMNDIIYDDGEFDFPLFLASIQDTPSQTITKDLNFTKITGSKLTLPVAITPIKPSNEKEQITTESEFTDFSPNNEQAEQIFLLQFINNNKNSNATKEKEQGEPTLKIFLDSDRRITHYSDIEIWRNFFEHNPDKISEQFLKYKKIEEIFPKLNQHLGNWISKAITSKNAIKIKLIMHVSNSIDKNLPQLTGQFEFKIFSGDDFFVCLEIKKLLPDAKSIKALQMQANYFKNTTQVALICDFRSKVIDCNYSAVNFFNRPKNQILSNFLYKVLQPNDSINFNKELSTNIKNNGYWQTTLAININSAKTTADINCKKLGQGPNTLLFVTINKTSTNKNQQTNHENNNISYKNPIYRELSHRVKNDLQIISSFLSLQSECINSDDAKKALDSAQDRILSLAKLQDRFVIKDNHPVVDFAEYVNDIKKHMQNMFIRLNSNKPDFNSDLEIKIFFDSLFIKQELATPLGLIVSELISNSIKHGLKNTAKPLITIDCKVHEQDKSGYLIIQDNGCGIKRSNAGQLIVNKTQTGGKEIIDMLAEQINGKVTYSENEHIAQDTQNPGCSVKITFKVPEDLPQNK